MKSTEALEQAIGRGLLGRYFNNEQPYRQGSDQCKPGAVIERMPTEVREALKELKAEDTFNVRPEYCV